MQEVDFEVVDLVLAIQGLLVGHHAARDGAEQLVGPDTVDKHRVRRREVEGRDDVVRIVGRVGLRERGQVPEDRFDGTAVGETTPNASFETALPLARGDVVRVQ